MPRVARTNDEIDIVRDEILAEALSIIHDEGYESLSMRLLGSRLGIAAKTVYNYFDSKEDIYIRVLIKGFEALTEQTLKSIEGVEDPFEQLSRINKTYIDFGRKNPNFYSIMFNLEVPKYEDYKGTNFEAIAAEERDVAFNYARLSEESLRRILEKSYPSIDDETMREKRISLTLSMWAIIHGIVSLSNSSAISNYLPDTDEYLDGMSDRILLALIKE